MFISRHRCWDLLLLYHHEGKASEVLSMLYTGRGKCEATNDIVVVVCVCYVQRVTSSLLCCGHVLHPAGKDH